MTYPVQIEEERTIVWLEPRESLPYVRETVVFTESRTAALQYAGEGRMVGYSVLTGSGRSPHPLYARRMFWLKAHDPYTDFPRHSPHEAVDPRTVHPMVPGRRTW